MRWIAVGVGMIIVAGQMAVARAEQKRSDQVLGGVLSGLLGQPQPSPDAVYTAKERDRLVSLLQSGDYATSRQGESIDLMVYGVPLTRTEHVYTAKPVPPSQTSFGQHPSQ